MNAHVTIAGKQSWFGEIPLVRMRTGICAVNSPQYERDKVSMQRHDAVMEAILEFKLQALLGSIEAKLKEK